MQVEVKSILNPKVAKSKFENICKVLPVTTNVIPPSISWKILSKSFPLIKIVVMFDETPRIRLVMNCANYDYESPTIYYESLNGVPIPWSNVRELAVTYPGMKFNKNVTLNDVILYPDGQGLVCRVGNEAYHQLHPEMNWQDIRTQDQGRLEFIIDSSVRLLDSEKLKEFGNST